MCVRIWRGVRPVGGSAHLDGKSAFRPCGRDLTEFFKGHGIAVMRPDERKAFINIDRPSGVTAQKPVTDQLPNGLRPTNWLRSCRYSGMILT